MALLRELVGREPVASLLAALGLTTVVVLLSLGEPVPGGLIVALVVGYVSGRSVSDAGRDAMYRECNDLLALAWLGSLLLVGGLALDWVGVIGASHDVSRLDASMYAVPALAIIGFVHGAWHEHLEHAQVHRELGAHGR